MITARVLIAVAIAAAATGCAVDAKKESAPAMSAAPATKAAPAAAAETPAKKIEHRVRKALGSSNRDVKRVRSVKWSAAKGTVTVAWAINDNLTEGLTKTGARLDAKEILEAVKDRAIPIKRVVLVGSFPLQDQYGNASEETVVRATFSGEVMDRINYETVDIRRIYDLADSAVIVPAFQY